MNKKVFFAVLIMGCLLVSSAHAANRTALVIGNGAYRISPLDNPVNDATDMAASLRRLGFDVILKKNADKKAMVSAVRSFGKKLSRSDIGLFYYAGHGMQINGTNYLIPIRCNIGEESEVEFEAIDAGRILAKMENAGNDMNIVILDACRDNPFKRSFRSSAKGLAKMDAPPGTLIAYATAPGSVASDGRGRNGAYTGALLRYMETPGLDVQKMFNRTGLEVMKKTNKTQVPWLSTTPIPDYYLAGGTPPEYTPKPRPKALPEKVVQQKKVPSKGNIWTDPVTGMEFVWVEGGCFQMGSNSGNSNEKPVHKVCLDGFWMGKYEVTQGQWKQIMGSNPSRFKNGDTYPVEKVSWNDCKQFILKLNQQSGQTFALPSEAQWEYAARSGGRDEKYSGGNDLDAVAWYNSNSGDKTHPVGTKAPNGLGIFDMSGNVWEWCEDVYDSKAYSRHFYQNPLITSGSSYRVLRGGSWSGNPRNVRSAYRNGIFVDFRNSHSGFRLCFPPVRH